MKHNGWNGEGKRESRMFENERKEHRMSEKKEKTTAIIVVAVIIVIAVLCIVLKLNWRLQALRTYL